jgi:hypothetical protein
VAIFKVHTSFNLTGRGVVIYGHLIEGNVLPGSSSLIEINATHARVRILEVGMGRPDGEGNTPWGLILAFENKDLEKIAITDRIKEQVITIFN